MTYSIEFWMCPFTINSVPPIHCSETWTNLTDAKEHAREVIRYQYKGFPDLRYARIKGSNNRIVWECEFWERKYDAPENRNPFHKHGEVIT